MYSVLSAFTRRPMPPATYSRLRGKVSARVGVFVRSAMSLVQSMSVIVCTGYLLLLSSANVKPFFFSLNLKTFEAQFEQVLPLRINVDLGMMATKGYSIFPISLELEPHYQMQFCVIPRTLIRIEKKQDRFDNLNSN